MTSRATPTPGDAEAQLAARGAKLRILLAEHNAVDRAVALELLRATKVQADAVPDGREALRMAGLHRYDLILMAVYLRHMDGPATARALRQIDACKSIPVVALGASGFAEERAACLAAGMQDYLPKPLTPEPLFAAILRWLPAVGNVERSPAQPLRDRLAAVPGLDIDSVLLLLGGRLDRYVRLLQTFAEAHGKDTEHIARHLAAGDRAEARALAHALKGAAAAVGLSGPADALAALEADLRGGAPDTQCLAALAALDRALAPVMAAIGALDLNAAAPAVAAGTLDAAAAELLLDRLESRLEAGAYEACDLWTRNAAQLHALLGADARRLEQQIGIFEFEAALATLRAARRPAVRRK